MSTTSTALLREDLMDWHEAADLRTYTTLAEGGEGAVMRHVAALAVQRDALTVQLWEAAVVLHDQTPHGQREFLADELAAALNVHPQTALSLMATAVAASEMPSLIEAARRGEITERHVLAALKVLPESLDLEVRDSVARSVLIRFRVEAEDSPGRGWPTPGELARALRKELLRYDLQAAAEREKAAAARRTISVFQLPGGQASLCLEGPAAEVLAMHDAILARTPSKSADDPRSAGARAFDTANQLLCDEPCRTEGGRQGGEIQVLVPLSTALGGDLELPELRGYGPILPSTARDLLSRADRLRRIVIDPHHGAVISVDDAVDVTGSTDADRAKQIRDLLDRMAAEPVVPQRLASASYRPTKRILRHIRARDRTCVFPGCTRRGEDTDADHRLPWPLGATSAENLHCLCRHHHRAKQARFIVTRETDGTTVWTSRRTGQRYFRPPHNW